MTSRDDETGGTVTPRISEDWAATIIGLALMVLAMLGVITKAMVP
jgi:hypothetical protein